MNAADKNPANPFPVTTEIIPTIKPMGIPNCVAPPTAPDRAPNTPPAAAPPIAPVTPFTALFGSAIDL